MALLGLSEYCGGEKAPGLILLEYLPIAWINTTQYMKLISSGWNWQQTIPLTEGSWLTAYSLPVKRGWSEKHRRSKQGKHFNQVVKAVVPHLLPSVQQEFDEMDQHEFIVKGETRDGQKWMIGTLEYPLSFRSDGNSGEIGSGLKGHVIEFSGPTIHKGYSYVPAF